jgi:hypothetical protein
MSLFWSVVAHIASRKKVRNWLIRRAVETPYSHIKEKDSQRVYMYRYWLFNPYKKSGEHKGFLINLLPSVRIHHILLPDTDRYFHDHPWNARTIILQGSYEEVRSANCSGLLRERGDTCTLKFGEFHRIVRVSDEGFSDGGVWTLFISGRTRGEWGFLVNGVKVPWSRHLNKEEPK